MPKRKYKEGWVLTHRKDPKTGRMRPCSVRFHKGKEVERHWEGEIPF